jgi:hypothetical protein
MSPSCTTILPSFQPILPCRFNRSHTLRPFAQITKVRISNDLSLMKPRLKSVWIAPAASGAKQSLEIAQQRFFHDRGEAVFQS